MAWVDTWVAVVRIKELLCNSQAKGCLQLGGIFKHYLELREHVKDYRDNGDVDQPRFGYEEEDAVKIMEFLKEKGSSFAPLAEFALGCGLRISELVGLKGKDVDKEHGLLHMVGKGDKP